jgi:hypothetical protein
MTSAYMGGCACGAIRYRIDGEPLAGLQCHCRDCQHASGGGHASLLLFARSMIEITGSPRFHEVQTDSGHHVGRGFCTDCGSPLFTQPRRFADRMAVTAGSLDDPARFQPTVVLWTRRAPSWDRTDPALPSFPDRRTTR